MHDFINKMRHTLTKCKILTIGYFYEFLCLANYILCIYSKMLNASEQKTYAF